MRMRVAIFREERSILALSHSLLKIAIDSNLVIEPNLVCELTVGFTLQCETDFLLQVWCSPLTPITTINNSSM
jgi:hypothetical protein